jgi:AraC-like DNA-binding protein
VSAEMIYAETAVGREAEAARRPDRLIRPVVDVLADGTVCYAPVGEVMMDGPLVICHLCGRSFRSVPAHLTAHGWTKRRYCTAFGLELSQPLESADTRKLRAAALTARLIFDPAIREGSAAGRARARSGELAKDAATAAIGRSFPEQRRRKASQVLTARPSAVVAKANRDRADRRLADVATAAARQRGYADLGAYVADRRSAGLSLTAISREAGLHKDWLSRHLRRVDPAAALAARQRPGAAGDITLGATTTRLGYQDVATYLRERHLDQHRTINAMVAELGVSRRVVTSALQRHGLVQVAHAAKRHEADRRAAEAAGRLGYTSIADYVARRRAAGLSWRAIAAESGEPQSWLRRHA